MNLTSEQDQAATDHHRALLVSASAGTGKTTVLAERVARLVDAGTSLDRILVVTYTERAAAQMRLRIGRVLRQRAATWPQGDPRARQLRLLDGAPIQTFHAFGDRIIREFGDVFGVDPDSDLLDGPAQEIFEREVLGEVLDAHEAAVRLASFFGGRSQQGLEEAVLGLARFARTLPDPGGWLMAAKRHLTDPDHAEQLYAMARRARIEALDGARRDLEEAARTASRLGLDAYSEAIGVWVGHLDDWLRRAALAHPGEPPALKPLPGTKGFDEEKKVVQDLLSHVRRTLVATADWLAFWDDGATRRAEAGRRAGDAVALIEVTGAHLTAYEAAKRAQGVIDFDDQASLAHRLVQGRDVPQGVAAQVRRRFDAILVDEFQDANAVQGALVDGLGGRDGPGLFMVGDVKQSIYAFRHAAPHLFLERHERYGDPGSQGPWRLPLRENFRSTVAIIDAVNGVFERVMRKGDDRGRRAIAYDAMHHLIPGRSPETMAGLPTDVRLVLLPREADEPFAEAAEEESPPETLYADEVEAAWVAGEIRRMVASGTLVHDATAGERRPARYGDFAILARGLTPMAGAVADALTKIGVPFTMARSRLLESLEYQTLKSLLALLEDPEGRPMELAAVMRSPLFRFPLARLAEIGLRGDRDLWRGLAADPSDDEALAVRATIERWRTWALLRPLGEALEAILGETRLTERIAGLPFGAQRQMDVEAVLALARKAEGRLQGLSGFLASLEAAEGRREAVEVSGVRLAPADAVNVMTVHGAKGLEFGVVFVTRLGARFQVGERSLVTMHRDLGLEVASVDRAGHVVYTSPFQEALDVENDREGLEEEMRILYVAMTRARDHLILVASSRDPERDAQGPGTSDPLRARRALDWLLPAARDGVLRIEMGAFHDQVAPVAATRDAPDAPEVTDDLKARLNALPDLGQPVSMGLPLRQTATGLAGDPAIGRPRRPKSLPLPGGRSPSEIGNLTHAFIEHIDLTADLSEEGLRRQVTRCVEDQILPARASDAIDIEALADFFRGVWGQGVLGAERVLREAPFARLLGEPGQESVLQGKVDLLAMRGDEALIVDFKTDHITRKDEAKAAQAYVPQMMAYREAVRELTGAKSVTVCLYFTRTGGAIIDPDLR